MNTELISTTSDPTGAGVIYHIAATRVVSGRPDDVQLRLASAAERLGYRVLSTQPLVARRSSRRWARYGCSSNVLEYGSTLNILLRPLTENATQVSFEWTIRSGWVTQGDRRVLGREADALVALSERKNTSAGCSICGTAAEDDSRFCRKCGAPLQAYEPPELESLRLAAGSQRAFVNLSTGAFMFVLAIIFALLPFVLPISNPEKLAKAFVILPSIAAGLGFAGIWSFVSGIWVLSKTLSEGTERRLPGEPVSSRTPIPARTTGPLPALMPPPSVTEHTTALLDPAVENRVLVERVKGRDTA